MSDQKVFLASKALIVKDGKFLALKRSANNKIFWDLPGGRVEFGETPEETLHREVMEEVGLEIDSVSLFGTYHFFIESRGEQVVCITYLCTPKSGEVDITRNPGEADITEGRWVTKDEFLGEAYPITNKNQVKNLLRSKGLTP